MIPNAERICDPEGRFPEPLRIMRDGESWEVATDTVCLRAQRGEDYELAPESAQATLAEVVGRMPSKGWDAIDLPRFREWVGEPSEPATEKCSSCHGLGWHECRDCEDEHSCGRCDGSGEVAAEVDRTGVVGPAEVDLERLARCLVDLDGSAKLWAGEERRPVWLRGESWVVAIMPRVRPDGRRPEDLPRWRWEPKHVGR